MVERAARRQLIPLQEVQAASHQLERFRRIPKPQTPQFTSAHKVDESLVVTFHSQNSWFLGDILHTQDHAAFVLKGLVQMLKTSLGRAEDARQEHYHPLQRCHVFIVQEVYLRTW